MLRPMMFIIVLDVLQFLEAERMLMKHALPLFNILIDYLVFKV